MMSLWVQGLEMAELEPALIEWRERHKAAGRVRKTCDCLGAAYVNFSEYENDCHLVLISL